MSTHTDRLAAERGHSPDHADPLPDREWGLSAMQVTVAVMAIIAVCELIGLLS